MAEHQANPEPDLVRLAGSVHTYESFGRAVVAAALTRAAKEGAFDATKPLTANITLRPISHAESTFVAGEDVVAGGKGHVPDVCYSVEVFDGGPTISVCW